MRSETCPVHHLRRFAIRTSDEHAGLAAANSGRNPVRVLRRVKLRAWKLTLAACTLLLARAAKCGEQAQYWTNYVRIGAYGLSGTNAESIVRDAQANHVFRIEVDNDISGRYESFVDPAEKLNAMRMPTEKAHATGNKTFVCIAGTECKQLRS